MNNSSQSEWIHLLKWKRSKKHNDDHGQEDKTDEAKAANNQPWSKRVVVQVTAIQQATAMQQSTMNQQKKEQNRKHHQQQQKTDWQLTTMMKQLTKTSYKDNERWQQQRKIAMAVARALDNINRLHDGLIAAVYCHSRVDYSCFCFGLPLSSVILLVWCCVFTVMIAVYRYDCCRVRQNKFWIGFWQWEMGVVSHWRNPIQNYFCETLGRGICKLVLITQ